MPENNKIVIHLLFLFILLVFGHIVSIVLFKDLTVFYHDNLILLWFTIKLLEILSQINIKTRAFF